MRPLDLPPRHLAALVTLLEDLVPESEVWAFGSRITGKSHDGSDLDLVLRNPANLSLPVKNLSELRETLSSSPLPFLIDIMDWARLPDTFRREIEKNHIILKEAPTQEIQDENNS